MESGIWLVRLTTPVFQIGLRFSYDGDFIHRGVSRQWGLGFPLKCCGVWLFLPYLGLCLLVGLEEHTVNRGIP